MKTVDIKKLVLIKSYVEQLGLYRQNNRLMSVIYSTWLELLRIIVIVIIWHIIVTSATSVKTHIYLCVVW